MNGSDHNNRYSVGPIIGSGGKWDFILAVDRIYSQLGNSKSKEKFGWNYI